MEKKGSSDLFCFEKNAIKFEKKKCSEIVCKIFSSKKQKKFVKNKLKRCFEIVCKTPVSKKTVRNIFLCKSDIQKNKFGKVWAS